MEKEKLLKSNILYGALKGIVSVLFPLITFPYITRVLGVYNVGVYNFVFSVVSYFILFSGLGIGLYAIREGAVIRNDSTKINEFCSEMLSINIISSIISYILLCILIVIVPEFSKYYILFMILALEIFLKTIELEWIFSIYEDYKYITIRSVIINLISLVLLFLFVRKDGDINIYAIISVIAYGGSNILNLIYSRYYVHFDLLKKRNLRKHIKPIMKFFVFSLTATIYINSDITLLGLISGTYYVGIYSVSTKIYTVIKMIIASMIAISIPRLSNLYGQKQRQEFYDTAKKIYCFMLSILIPVTIGLIILHKEIILFLSSSDYLAATPSLIILSIALMFCICGYFWAQCILIPMNKENTVVKITIISAILNVVLNLIAIPLFKETGAAVTTVISELIVFIYCFYVGKNKTNLKFPILFFIKIIFGSIAIPISYLVAKIVFTNITYIIILTVLLSVIIYISIEILLKNEVVKDFICIKKI